MSIGTPTINGIPIAIKGNANSAGIFLKNIKIEKTIKISNKAPE
jgi:hypothetical protein